MHRSRVFSGPPTIALGLGLSATPRRGTKGYRQSLKMLIDFEGAHV
jgi:hypothetical protein